MSVVIETTIGDLTVDLFLKERPRACQNFLKLCKIKYYNFSLFHTVQRDFIAQTGDPAGTGKGGTSLYGLLYGDQARYFEAEKAPKIKHRNLGTLSFASHGDNLLGSQFFVTLSESLESLDGEHCVFGQVVEGTEVLAKLNDAICDQNFQPYQDIRITHTVVLDDPLDDPEGLEVPSRSPSPTADVLKSGRIAADEDVEEMAGRSAAELDEMIQQREAAARATILEMVGDLPDADVAPPENVLFVCKLNPVTTDDDLQIIFSRFGKIVSCEIIRDHKTNNSLQYGFIEFDNPRSCENAYFKMDNVLIDDRRIHVDFSQSVSRVQWKGKGRITFQKGTDAKDFGNYTGQGGHSGDKGRGLERTGRPNPSARDRRSEWGGSTQGNGRRERERNGRERGGRSGHSERRREEIGEADDRRREERTDRKRYEERDERKLEDRRREDGRNTSRPGRRDGGRGAAVSEHSTEGRHGREDRADEGRSRHKGPQFAGGLDVNQLKALLGKKDKTRSSSGSSDEPDTTSKKKKKRHRRESPSDSDSSSDKTPPKKQKSRREHSSSPERKEVKRHNSSKRDRDSPKRDKKSTKKKRKDKSRDHKSEKRVKKNKKQRRQTSSDDSSTSSSSEENYRKRKKAKKGS